ncbi:fructokinase-like 2 chloroplastic [Tripterygium wilfordii]|uniref:Fructokinase-like 2 chloroplastic n=1 Tax=Tripterygium wilfordii TaxID=458696 RepID=A0A7J7BZ48_TRIWF|nr:fructokinase-like 2, chloroplastic [Tripterygium wilfordii]KAF5727144.1 fructokinase-like 2 chloroplastic [Tripterygium wilfordii]
MESLPFTQFLSLPRWHFSPLKSPDLVRFQDLSRLKSKWVIAAMSRKKVVQDLAQEGASDNEAVVKKTTRTAKRTATRVRKKKASKDIPAENSELEVTNYAMDEESTVSTSTEDSKKTPRRRRKAASASAAVEEEKTENTVRTRRKTRKKDQVVEDQASELEISDQEESSFIKNVEDDDEDDLELEMHEVEDISFTYGWPPLVCCFGAAQHAFVPSGRPANRLIDYEIHERMKDALWSPDSFVRAPGGSASTVAIALASLGGKVAFLGKLGDDDYGRAMLYYMNVNNVQTRSVCIDSRRTTAISHMKLAKRGRLRATCIKTCVEDSLSKSDINVDVLKEAKMFYFSTHSLLDQNMRSTTLRAIRISKELGGVIFYDVNLPLPLWQSSEETKMFIQKVWNLANIIEVTKQELEFLCGIEPVEEFDTKTNARSKFVHYEPEVVAPLWHENLKVLIVTNGTSKIHYYTEEHNGAVHGMEDAPITPFTADMSASGDGIVAGLMRMLALQLHRITDKEYLERTIKYAINCGVIDQWLLGRERGFPPREDAEEEVEPDPNGIRSITEKEYRTVGAVNPVS